jgi:hypothetical protein
LAVGVPLDDVGTVSNQGSVRIFVRSGTTWTAQQTLTASDGVTNDDFGTSVSLDGDTLAVGADFDDVGSVSNQGSVRIFVRSGTTWTAQQTLTASDGAAGDNFGNSVSLDGDTLAVGVLYDSVGANSFQGSVRVFVRSGSTWSAQQTLTASDGAVFDSFGFSVSLDGDTLAVGVSSDDVGTNSDQGSVRMFVRSGSTWSAQATLLASDGAAGDFFGYSVSLDGDTLAGGADFDDVGSVSNQGSVRIFGNYRVFNDTTNVGFTSLASAIAGSSPGARLIVGAPAFAEADGIIDASQKRFNFVAVEPIALSSTALMTVATNTVFERSLDVASAGLTVNGDLAAPLNGTVTFEQLSVGTGGQFLQRGSTILVNQNLASTSGGICYLQGPILAEAVTTAVGAQNRCAGDTDVFANYTNAGTTIVQRGILYIYGTLTNTGTLTGEVDTNFMPPAPGDGYSIGGDYAVDAASAIVLPDPVWWLRVGGSFDMAINSASRFVMDQATLEMTGIGDSAVQSLEVFARDFGAIDDGFATTNYLVGALRIRAGANVSLEDNHNNVPGKTAEAIYTNELFVPAGATLTTNGYRIYTRAATIAGTVSNPADIIVVPDAPPCPADLFPDGIVSAADLSILLERWGPCSGSCIADIDGDGQVGASDLSLLLASWGACAAN